MKVILIIIMLSTLSGIVRAENLELFDNLEGIETVVIELDGYIELNSWQKDQLQSDYELKTSGQVIGFSNKDKRDPYVLSKRISQDTLYITANEREDLWGVGLMFYSEKPHHIFYLPEHLIAKVISNNARVQVNGDFNELTIKNTGESVAVFEKDKIGTLICASGNKKVSVNGEPYDSIYKYSSSGNNVYILESSHIRVTLK